MNVVVQKFGGSSVATVEHIRNVASIIAKERAAGNKIVVVVSAMAGITDELEKTVKQLASPNNTTDSTECDVVVSSGEQVSSALLYIALQSLGYKSRSWMGWQLPIKSDCNYGKARIISVNIDNIYASLSNDEIPIIAGFQCINTENGSVH